MNSKQFYYVILGAMGLLAITGAVGYYFATRMLTDQTKQLATRLGDVQIAQDKVDSLQKLKFQYQRISPIIPKLNAALPATKQQSEIVLQLQQLAAQAGMSLPATSFAPISTLPGPTSQTVKAGDALAIPVSFQLTGNYDQLIKFLQSLERQGRYTNVTMLSVSKNTSAKALGFSLSINVYIKP
jgi:Tfp pilus assembly protein PilO